MQQDFHYNVTYRAATAAGFSQPESEKIAWAAQHVDDATNDNSKVISFDSKHKYKYTFKYLRTATSNLQSVRQTSDDYLREVWMVNHFLPGNFTVGEKKPHHILRSFRGMDNDEFTSYKPKKSWSKKHLYHICRPHSPLAVHIVNEVRKKMHRDESGKDSWEGFGGKNDLMLFYIGVTMHVFADTWAHQDHLGAPDHSYNNVESFGKYRKGKWVENNRFRGSDYVPSANKGMSTNALAKISHQGANAQLGHGAIGTIPDKPHYVYVWKPRWADREIVKNNPEQFLEAFVHMIYAMKCIKKDKEYKPLEDNKYSNIAHATRIQKFKDCIKIFIGKKASDRTDAKRAKIWTEKLKYKTIPKEYDKNSEDKYYEDSHKHNKKRKSRYEYSDFVKSYKFLFHCAANLHYAVVMNFLKENGHPISLNPHLPNILAKDDIVQMMEKKRDSESHYR